MALVPSKGVFTNYILSDYKTKMDAKKAMYDSIMTSIFDPEKSFDRVKASVDKYLNDSERVLKFKQYEFYINVDLGELWKAGATHNLWIHNENGTCIDFSASRNMIRDNPYNNQKGFDEHFENSPYVKNWLAAVAIWFEGGVLGRPQCRWYEASGNPELWVRVDMKNVYASAAEDRGLHL